MKGRVLGDHVFDNIEHFCQTNGHNELGWLLLIGLDKVGKQKKLRDLNSHSDAA